MQINGVELNFDFGSISFTEKFDVALQKMQSNSNSIKECKTEAEVKRKFVQELHQFINEVWGDDTYEKIGIDPDRFSDNADLLTNIADESNRLRMEDQERIKKLASKYTPNRAQRRAKKK